MTISEPDHFTGQQVLDYFRDQTLELTVSSTTSASMGDDAQVLRGSLLVVSTPDSLKIFIIFGTCAVFQNESECRH